jgi:cytochrome o ubiquinol oxidase subunit II
MVAARSPAVAMTTSKRSSVRIPLSCSSLLAWLALSGCQTAVLTPAGPVSAGERVILLDSLAIMLAIVVPTIVATLAFAWWFRASNGRARYLPDWAYSGRLELLVWSVPALVIFFLGGIAWISAHLLDPAVPLKSKQRPLDVEVVSLDWKWLFILPEQNVASINELTVPVGIPLRFRITSASVFNVFFVPQLGSEIYSMYGMTSRLNLEADRPGTYFGLSAHFSGDGFPGMTFDVHALAPEEFSQWIARTRRDGPALDDAAYRALLKQTQAVQPHTYSSVRAHLFDDIVGQRLPPGEGPATAQQTSAAAAMLAQGIH